MIVKWFQFNRRNSQPLPGQIPQWGGSRYKLYHIGNMDQTPIPYEFLDGAVYDFKGAKTVWIKQSRSGWEKRCATLMIYVSADGLKHCRPLLIFKGQGKHANIKREMKKYHRDVVVQWNKKAYCNNEIMLYWLKHMYRTATPDFTEAKPPRLLSLDVFAGQKTPEVKQAFKDLNIIPSFIPSGCTGYVQVLDVAINKPLKAMLSDAAEKHYSENFEKWQSNQYTVGERRIMLTNWVGEAWTKLHKEKGHVIRETFRKLGLSLAVDGSEDHEISVKDINDLEVGDWRLSDTTTEDVYNALDPTEQRKLQRATKGYSNTSNEYVHDTEDLALLEENEDGEIDAEGVTDSEMDFDSSSDEEV